MAPRTLHTISVITPLLQLRTLFHSTTPNQLQTTRLQSFSTAPAMQPKIATGQNESKVKAELEELVEGGWQLDKEQIQLEKTYHLASYRSVKFLALEIMSRSQIKNHHPVLHTNFSSVSVYWTTHTPRGLSEKDTFMATYCDTVAKSIGTVDSGDTKKCGSAQSPQI